MSDWRPTDSPSPDGARREDQRAPIASGAPPPAPSAAPPGCVASLLLLPVSPLLWARASAAPVWRTLLPVYALTVIVSVFGGYVYGKRAVEGLRRLGEFYEQRGWSPVVIAADNTIRVDGDRPPRMAEKSALFAVDPDNDLAEERKKYRELLIVGRTAVTQAQGAWSHDYPIGLFADTLRRLAPAAPETGEPPAELRIDAAFFRGVVSEHGGAIRVALLIALGGAFTLAGWCSAPVYALIAGALALAFAGRARGLRFGQCFKIAFAAVAAKTLIDGLLIATGAASPFDFVFYGPLVLILTLMAISRAWPAAASPNRKA